MTKKQINILNKSLVIIAFILPIILSLYFVFPSIKKAILLTVIIGYAILMTLDRFIIEIKWREKELQRINQEHKRYMDLIKDLQNG